MTDQTDTPIETTAADASALARDLEQLSELATLVASARDAMSDEIVTRLSSAFSEGITLLDRLTRNEGVMSVLKMLDSPEIQYYLHGLCEALPKMSREVATSPPAKGGITGLLQVAMDPGTQEGLRSLALLGKYWSESLRELHRHGTGS